MHKIACYHKPSKTVFLDDNKVFLASLKSAMPEDLYYQTYSKPQQFIDFFVKRYRKEAYFPHCLTGNDENAADAATVNVDIPAIHQLIYDPERFHEIAVAVIDYALPGTTGIEVCRQLQDIPCRKILLTGEAGYELAVQAFNEGTIHQFIIKNTPEYGEQLVTAIRTQQQLYYLMLSQLMIDSLMRTSPSKMAFLQDTAFAKLFHDLCKQYAIVEYYLLDVFGAFLLLNKHAHPVWLLMKDEEEMKNLHDFAEASAAPASIVRALKARKKIPFFYSTEDFDTPPDEWESYLHTAQVLEADQRYYYALTKGTSRYHLDSTRILPYRTFLTQKS